jgi:hypothetical protein
MDLKHVVYEDVDWMDVLLDRTQWRLLLNIRVVMALRV